MAQSGCSNGDGRWSLKGMTALVTGGTRGIGHAIVEELAGLGARIHPCSRTETELNECLRDWEGRGFEVTGSKLMETISSKFNGRLNILINNAGTGKPGRTVEFTAEEFSTVMAVNSESVYHLCQLAHPLMKASGAGSIVLMSSVAGVVSLKYLSAYGATKGALNQLAKNLACEAQDNIRTNSVVPLFLSEKSFMEEVIRRTPQVGDPKEVSSLYCPLSEDTCEKCGSTLCLPTSSNITGQTICVDGGISVNDFNPSQC
ncbi:hypothetical protein PVL29_007534 [Vitis rotundifolia]|uniref:Uncharacterized protein n=1 Tax=Vitis rotundifolia TaxID=103349 RepID=A0AA39DUW2_VITRO|nr:hypothetical protein PVL29_007534 [Vitis rotundifolia]